ncbi:MAG: SDR family NAD(P)-dependent oxidoreductase [Candidatus Binatia bacterium]|nr:SDR family NAD(P)-dependent oxidoreductase [Candidatus Binatia bacterium]
MGSLTGRVALVTGASRGIGVGIARRLSGAGAAVAVTARSLEPHPKLPGTLRETLNLLAGPAPSVAISADLSDVSDRARVIAEVEEKLGPIDILVNNAARAFYEPAHTISDKRMRLGMELNLLAPLDLIQRVVPGMRARGAGWIVNLSSATTVAPSGPPWNEFTKTSGTYAAAKAALERLTVGLAAELHGDGIAVNTLAPVAAVYTAAAAQMGKMPDDPSMIEPLEVMAEAALALCACDPAVLTGRVTYSGPLLKELGIEPRPLDG